MNDIYRRDVEQADVAALMAALIGIDWPINSVGVLPDIDPTRPGFLASGDESGSEAKLALVNAKVCRVSSSPLIAVADRDRCSRCFRSCLNISDENIVRRGMADEEVLTDPYHL